MRTRGKLALAALAVAITLGALVGTTSANRIALSNQTFRATWSSLGFVGFASIRCHVTMEGSFHSKTLAKVAEGLIGYVTRATVDEGHCTGGSARVLQETLPWHIRFESFSGTLPNITVAWKRIVGAGWQVGANVLGAPVLCLFTSTAASPLRGGANISAGVVESLTLTETSQIPRSSGSELCGTSGRLAGTSASLTVLGTTTKITVTLVA
jgi:hypothetical protein